jgi:glucose 1-dehydrogenase
MRAVTAVPGQSWTVGVEEVPEPVGQDGALLVRGRLIGVCGTDREIADGVYGEPPEGEPKLIIGHEGLGEVIEAPAGSGFAAGDLVVGIVRRPDPVPCPACADDQWDTCRNNQFAERGIVRRHGYASEHWRVEPEFALRIPPRLGAARRAPGAQVGTGQGVGPSRPDFAEGVLSRRPGDGHRRWPDRVARVPARRAARI